MKTKSIFLILSIVLHSLVYGANPIEEPIVIGGLNVHTRKFSQLPDEGGRSAQIICIIPYLKWIYVCTATKIYRLHPNGDFNEWFDVQTAVKMSTGRNVNLMNGQHGGVRSIAFHPRQRKFYVSFMEDRPSNPEDFQYLSDATTPIPADSVLAEFQYTRITSPPDPLSYRQVIRIGMPVYDHPIKQIAFYRGFLYICHGDGSEQSASAGGGQNNDALGKILRIDPVSFNGHPYRVPTDNPFMNSKEMLDEVFAYGFRNPHHLCFGRDGTLYVADAGRDNIEEVNIVKKGRNYGWSLREGTFVHAGRGLIVGLEPLPEDDEENDFEYPAAQWGHEGPVGAGFVGQAIAGGCPVDNGSPITGNYFYGDFPVSGRLFFSRISELKRAVTRGDPTLLTQAPTRQATIFYDHDDDPDTEPLELETLGDVVRTDPKGAGSRRADIRFGRGPRGEMYWSSKATGTVYLITSSLISGPGGPTSRFLREI